PQIAPSGLPRHRRLRPFRPQRRRIQLGKNRQGRRAEARGRHLMSKTAEKVFRIGHSPDPDDAFMFYAMAKGIVKIPGFRIEHVMEDIQSLNKRAFSGELEMTAISAHAYPKVADKYGILHC